MAQPTTPVSVYTSVVDCFDMHGRIPSNIPPEQLEEVRDALPSNAPAALRAQIDAAIADPAS